MTIVLCRLICSGNNFINMEEFDRARLAWLKQFPELPHGIPDSDTFRRVFERLNPAELADCLCNWQSSHRAEGSIFALDSKTICGSGNNKHKENKELWKSCQRKRSFFTYRLYE